MLVNKKVNFTVNSIEEKVDGTMLVKFSPIMPEGVQWGSPSDPLMVIVQKGENILAVGQEFEGFVVAQYDDGIPVEG